ncbi:MAG TPA: glycosyltransferase [Tahibacter sp.]|nr:glycosyltransferase [Tahibacter sp.]
MARIFGTGHRNLIDFLQQDWWINGPAVCVVEGFPGVGKTRIAEELLDRLGNEPSKAPMLECPPAGAGLVDNLLLELAEKLSELGDQRLAESLGTSTLKHLLAEPILLVIDEFQRGFLPETSTPEPSLYRLLEEVARNGRRGRVLLLSSRNLERDRTNERWEIRTLKGLPSAEAIELLNHFGERENVRESIPEDRKTDIVTWLGGYPRAIKLFASRLRYEPLNSVLGAAHEAWEAQDRTVSHELLTRIESDMFQRACDGLSPAADRLIRRLAVFRHPVESEAMERLLDPGEDLPKLRDDLIDRFVIELRRGRYAMPSLLRDTVHARTGGEFRLKAHRMAGEWFGRHFRARQIVGIPEKLGGAFVEARYHFVQAGDVDALHQIGQRFEAHVRARMTWSTPMPQGEAELEERIAFLSALLADGDGARGLHYYLAKLLDHRRRPGDMAQAIGHIRKATGPKSSTQAWLLRLRIEAEVSGAESVFGVVGEYQGQHDLFADVFVAGARILDGAGKTEEAIRMLRRGIGMVGSRHDLSVLCQAAAEMLEHIGKADQAVELLREGIGKVDGHEGLRSLYQAAAEILGRAGKTDEAIALLREGIDEIGADQSLHSLYQAAGEILDRAGRVDEAVKLLREGTGRLGANQSLFVLYQSIAKVWERNGQTEKSIEALQEGIRVIPRTRSSGRYKLMNWLVYAAYAAADKGRLTAALSATGAQSLEPIQQGLTRILLSELAGKWEDAASIAAKLRSEFPPFDLGLREAFAHLCAGFPDKAERTFDGLPAAKLGPGNPLCWLRAFIAVEAGDASMARTWLSRFGVAAPGESLDTLRQELLTLWDDSPHGDETHVLAYCFPHLPPRLTGLDTTITRRQFGPGALPHRGDPAPVPGDAQRAAHASRPLQILVVCTEWFSRHGGLPTLNRDLCIALHRAGQHVVCLVADMTLDEEEHARKNGVTLIQARRESGVDDRARLNLRAVMPNGFVPDVVIGHDHITGAAAKIQCDDFFPQARRVHLIHTAPGEIEWFKTQAGATAARKSEDKERRQRELAASAHLVVAVGPRLYGDIETVLHGVDNPPPLYRLDPGFSAPKSEHGMPLRAQCLILGRTEDAELKGLDIGSRAIGLMQRNRPALIVRGASPGEGDALRKELLEWAASPGMEVRTREYVANTEHLREDLKTASLLLMPSRSEGFGLVGLEALAVGTPILVSSRSGLAELIREHCAPDVADRCIADVTGEREIDAMVWEREIAAIMRDRRAAFRNALDMAAVLAEKLSWEKAAENLLVAIRATG